MHEELGFYFFNNNIFFVTWAGQNVSMLAMTLSAKVANFWLLDS